MSVFAPVFQKICLKCIILVLLCSAVLQVRSQAVVHNGDLDILSDGDVPNNVTSITHITGNLTVGGSISSFPDFVALEMVDGNINIGGILQPLSSSLTTLSAIFPALTTIGGTLKMIRNPHLKVLSGFDVLQSIGVDLFISYNNTLISIPEFSMLKRIGRNFRIGSPVFWGLTGNRLLTGISGFDMLEHVAGDISIQSNSALTSVTPFPSLNYVGGGISISYHDKLPVLDSMFPVLKTVGEELLFTLNTGLTIISGFDSLQRIANISIHHNEALIRIPEFPLLDTIASQLKVHNNVKLAGISGFNSLQTVGSIDMNINLSLASISGFNSLANTTAITARDNPSLAGIAGFTMLSSVSSVLSIHHNYSLTALSAFSSLRHIGESLEATGTPLTVTDNASLTDLGTLASFAPSALPAGYTLGGTGMALFENNGGGNYSGGNLVIFSDALIPANIATITHVTGDLTIGGDVRAFPELTNLQVVEGSLNIGNDFPLSDPSLTVLNGIFPSLSRINGHLIISRNSFLTSVAGFNLTSTIWNSVEIKHNPLLTSIPKFDSLITAKKVSITNNDNLMSVSEFNRLNSAEYLGIEGNEILTTVSGFNTLHTLVWRLRITDNPLLTNVDLPALRSVEGDSREWATPIQIFDNPVLEDCDFVRPFLLGSPGYTLGGNKSVYVQSNATGCASAAAILAEGVHLNLSTTPSIVDGLSPASGVFSLAIDMSNATTSWRITKEDNDGFVTFPVASGRQDSTLEVSYSMNTKATERTATVTVTVTNGSGVTADSTFTVSQAGMVAISTGDVHLNLSTTPSIVDGLSPASGVFSLAIDMSNATTSWRITKEDNDGFVTLPVASGRQDSTLEVSYSMNTKATERTATVTVTVTNGSGVTADSTVTISQAGMATALSAIATPSKGLNFYPNPGTGHFVIEYSKPVTKVRLLDLTGKILPVDKYMSNKTDTGIEFDLSPLKKGIYIVMLDNQRVRLFLK